MRKSLTTDYDKLPMVGAWSEITGMKKDDVDTIVTQLIVAITEVREVYYLGIFEKNEKEIVDGYVDVWWMNGMLLALTNGRCNFNLFLEGVYEDIEKHFPGLLEERLEKAISEVIKSNFSKFDNSLDDALKTAKKYEDLGVHTYHKRTVTDRLSKEETFYVTFSKEDTVGSDGKFYNKDKVLKSINFVEPHQ